MCCTLRWRCREQPTGEEDDVIIIVSIDKKDMKFGNTNLVSVGQRQIYELLVVILEIVALDCSVQGGKTINHQLNITVESFQ